MAITVFLSVLLIIISYYISTLFNIRLAWDMPLNRATLVRQIDFTVNNGLVFPLTVSGFAIGIKMGKNFYLQQLINERLAKQKIDTQVQLLKSKVHPRFLFHSLNSIYSDMLNGAKQSPEMLLKLSDLLSYILYESDSIMPLDKEIELLKNYIDLEKISRGSKLITEMQDEADTNGKFIEPLLLLPLAEYVFSAHDAGKEATAFLNISMKTSENVFFINIGYRSGNVENSYKDNIQLAQVEKRLMAQYSGKHNFKVTNDANSVTIFLSLVLDAVREKNINVAAV